MRIDSSLAFVAVLSLTASTFALAGDERGTVTGSVSAAGPALRVVYIERAPEAAKPPESRVVVRQKGTQFRPGAAVVMQGQRVDFPNEDKFFHNVFSVSAGNSFDLGMYRAGASKSKTLEKPGEVEVFCNIHPNMEARLLVLQNEYYVVLEEDTSKFALDVPPGKYTLVAWSDQHEPEKQVVDVRAGAKVRADFTLKAREGREHLNKHGQQYGRYK